MVIIQFLYLKLNTNTIIINAGKTLTFALEAPGAGTGNSLGLHDLQAKFFRGDFPWSKVWQKLGWSRS